MICWRRRERFGGGEYTNDDGGCKDGEGGLMMVEMLLVREEREREGEGEGEGERERELRWGDVSSS